MDLNQYPMLFNFVKQASLTHTPYQSKIKNKNYQIKYIKLFEFIFSKLKNIDSRSPISSKELKKIGKGQYRKIIVDLHNDNLIFYPMVNNQITHGNLMFSKYQKTVGTLIGNYCLSINLINQIKNNQYKLYIRPKYNGVPYTFGAFIDLNQMYLNNIKQILNNNQKQVPVQTPSVKQLLNQLKNASNNKDIKQSRKILSKFRKEVSTALLKEETKIYTENTNYLNLTLDGKPLLNELPHYGKYLDGRIYSKFHCISKNLRKKLKFNNDQLFEFGDVSHAYPTFIGKLIENKLPQNKVKEYQHYIKNNDIYTDTLKFGQLTITKETRNSIKPYFNKYINSTIKDNILNSKLTRTNNNPQLLKLVINFMKQKFPEIHNFIWNYQTSISKYYDIKKLKWKIKTNKNIAHDLQKIEKQIISKITSKLNIPFITLHDGIYIEKQKQQFINFEFKKQLDLLLNF